MLLDRVSSGQTGQGIEALKWMEAKAVSQIIAGEHPQIAAIVLAHLEPEQSAAVLPLLTEEKRTDILMRIASLNEVPQSALTELDQLVEKQANAAPPSALRKVGGARHRRDILNSMEKEKSTEEMGKIEKADGEMHQQIKDLLFVFDNLLDIDDRGIQALLREVGSDTLAVALRGAEPEVQDRILKNMSKRAAEILKDDMEARGPVKLTDVGDGAEGDRRHRSASRRRGHHQSRRQGAAASLSENAKSGRGGQAAPPVSERAKFAAAERWTAPDVSSPAAAGSFPTVAGLADLQAEAHKEAFDQGLKEGREAGPRRGAGAGRAAVRDVLRPREALRDLGRRGGARAAHPGDGAGPPDRAARAQDGSLADHRDRPRGDRRAARGRPRRARAPASRGRRGVCGSISHRPRPSAPGSSSEDPVMARGGCQITTATSRIDARLETRLGAILSEAPSVMPTPRAEPRERPRPRRWAEALVHARERMANVSEIIVEGTLNRMVGMTLEAVGCEAAVGGRCLIDTAEDRQIEAEVVGFSGDKLFLMPTGDIRGVMPGARVVPTRSVSTAAVGDELLGPRARRCGPALGRARAS